MAEIKGSTLFIVGSPFQCLCMLEAIDYFQIRDYDILVVYSDGMSLGKIKKLLEDKNLRYSVRHYAHIIKTVLPVIFSRHRHYKNVVLGDYFGGYEALASIYAGLGCRIHYIDDGNQALEIFSDCSRKRYKSKKIAFVFALYNLLFRLKGGKEHIFFTIYPVETDRYEIVHNGFQHLKGATCGEKSGVYIIGTNSSALEFKDVTYDEMMRKLTENIKARFPGEKILYCPHRRDRNNEQVFALCSELGIDIYNTEVSVEYDFASKGFNPSLIVGFTSNALYALRMIYPESEIETVLYHLQDERADESTAVIVEGMKKVGIKAIDII